MAAKRSKKAAQASKVYKMTEMVGTSPVSFEAATSAAVERACETLRNVDWFQVSELRGAVRDGKVHEFQVTLKVGFRLD
jgi:flavin-binding protein dodecin